MGIEQMINMDGPGGVRLPDDPIVDRFSPVTRA
jgi:hypothetical protein